MTHKQDLSRRDFIKATTAFIGGLIGVSIGLPSIHLSAFTLPPQNGR